MMGGMLLAEIAWERIQSNADWVLPVGTCVAILLFVRWMYRRDAVELRPALRILLTVLRTAVFLGLLVLYLQPQWREEREIVRNSRAVVLVDTSMSMGLSDSATGPVLDPPHQSKASAREKAPGTAAPGRLESRLQMVAGMLQNTDFLDQLRRTHNVSLYQFNDDLSTDRATTLMKKVAATPAQAGKEKSIDWQKILLPSGNETRLGQALQQLLTSERGSPLSGIILLSDGGQNAGISPDAAVALAQEMKTPIYAVGLGSDKQPANVRVSDLLLPARAYPGDRYTVTGYLQAQRLGGKSATVEILSRPADGPAGDEGTGTLLGTQQVILGGDNEVLPVPFEITPDKPGRLTICFRIRPPPDDRSPEDNFREEEIEIVDRKNRVLLLAGGPTREYQFLRSLLSRDRATQLDVLLQTAQPGISQEGNLLEGFPAARKEMYDYDCIVAFDPDWKQLTSQQMELLESWVAEQGGGLIVIPGPIHAGKSIGGWTQDPGLRAIRNLYPVEFPRRISSLENTIAAADEPYPLSFSREGLEADFLRLGDSAASSRRAWAGFPGVFSYAPVRGAKPGATVYARLSDRRGGEGPVYFAGQFYGSGSVFYLGSGEMWRLRALDESYFEQFYTKLIRHVSQGRLLRGSTRGVLLVGQDRYLPGNSVEVRAQLTDARREPLRAPSVPLQAIGPDGAAQTVALLPETGRPGAYAGRFPAMQAGTYRLELPIPESDNQRLTRRVQVTLPELEREHPQRNDDLLRGIAVKTGGKYYIGIAAALDRKTPLAAELPNRTATIVQTDDIDPRRQEIWLRWMMIALCGLLCVEWLIRRLVKLA